MFNNLKSFYMYAIFPFDPIFLYTNLTIETNGVICLIVLSSGQVIDDNFVFNSIAIRTV